MKLLYQREAASKSRLTFVLFKNLEPRGPFGLIYLWTFARLLGIVVLRREKDGAGLYHSRTNYQRERRRTHF